MIFPNITFKQTNSGIGEATQNTVTQKLTVLQKYMADANDVRCEVEFEKVTSHKSGMICRVEVNLWVEGELFRAENTQTTFEAAIDAVRDELDQEMNKSHKKRHSLMRRGGRKIKEMMRWGN